MDSINQWIEEAWTLGMHNPDIAAVLLGNLSGFALTLAVELYFLPTVTDLDKKRRQKGYTFLLCWLASSVASSMLWLAWDKVDPPFLRWTICVTLSVLGFFAYPALARYLTAKFPAIGTAWNADKPS